ncbi:hypothetical protein CTI12_AA354370 [Artemisia annua]|uniref:Serine-rich protein-related protein n=1 Tax=Artemisia annua TaxID=35608 RepID=A0A2U1LD90_ARTAN|nr:hypothetical protein CTI12_AA354370 [Artemisia annua]
MSNPTRRPSTTILRSHSPSRRFQTSSSFPTRSASPTRVNLYTSSPSSSSVKYTRHLSQQQKTTTTSPRRMCMCSPTSHPGSFRCSLHKNSCNTVKTVNNSFPSNRLNARRSAMTNSLVRIGTVEGGDLVKRALSALIRPSSHQQRRRTSFQRMKSRLSVMTSANDL